MFTGCRREHHPEAKTSQKVTDKFAEYRQKRTIISDQNRDGFSEYKNFERELISGCRTQIIVERIISYRNGNENPGILLTNRDFHLQTGNLAYKPGLSFTKWESWFTNGILSLLFTNIDSLNFICLKIILTLSKNMFII